MAGLFSPTDSGKCRLLDAGAGIGSLSCAFLERCISGGLVFDNIEVTAFELDRILHGELDRSLFGYFDRLPLSYSILGGDFVEAAVTRVQFQQGTFTHAILNPPYKKIAASSRHRLLLRKLGVETVNLYSAFVALAVSLVEPCGQIVAIIPRSFCNGPYYRQFRDFVLGRAAIRRMHLFESRTKAFKDDDVLQENIIISLERGGQQGSVEVSTSTDDSFADLVSYTHAFERIVLPDDPERFIHVPTSPRRSALELSSAVRYSLADLGVSVSTGAVVDFRVREHLRPVSEPGTVPLLYPAHFSGSGTKWPKPGMKKPNAIRRNGETEKWLYPNSYYCVVRRFSSKEEDRRIVASVVDPDAFDGAPMLGFENHLNVFHDHRRGLPRALANGLAVYLNTSAVDESFRRFSGHTQVNATDLRLMKYPSRETLNGLGEWALNSGEVTQEMIDQKLGALIA